jgi:hypothetical protein
LAVLAAMLGNTEPFLKRLAGSSQPVAIWATQTPEFPIRDEFWNWMEASEKEVRWHLLGEMAAWSGSVPAFAYDGSVYVSDATIRLIAGIPKPERGTCLSFSRAEKLSENLLQAITNLKVQAGMEQMRPEKTETRFTQIVQGLENTITNITGQRFYFNVRGYDQPNLLVGWGSSELPFNLFKRLDPPKFLSEKWEEWGIDWERRRATGACTFYWHQVEGQMVHHKSCLF